MPKRTILFPLKQGSRTPEEFREAVRKVKAERETANWTKVTQASDLPPTRIVADPPSDTEHTDPSLTDSQPHAKLRSVRKRVLLEPAVRPPNRALIQAAVEKVVAERKRREAEKRAAARTARLSRRSEPTQEG